MQVLIHWKCGWHGAFALIGLWAEEKWTINTNHGGGERIRQGKELKNKELWGWHCSCSDFWAKTLENGTSRVG